MTKKLDVVCFLYIGFLSVSLGMPTVHLAYAQAPQRYNSTTKQMELWRTTEWKILGVPTKFQKSSEPCTTAGQQTYNTATNRMEFCSNGTNKFSLICGVSVIGCGSSSKGRQEYSNDLRVMLYCNGENWVYMGSVPDVPCCPEGFVPVPKNAAAGTTRDFCVSKYHMKAVHKGTHAPVDGINLGNSGAYYAESRDSNTPWTAVDLDFAKNACNDLNKAGVPGNFHLITNAEWMTVAYSIESNVQNWSEDAVGAGHLPTGHSDGFLISGQNFRDADPTDSNPCLGTGNPNCTDKHHDDFWQKRTFILDNPSANNVTIWDMAGNVNSWVDTGENLNMHSSPLAGDVYQLNDTGDLFNPGPAEIYANITPLLFPPDPVASKNQLAFLPQYTLVYGTNFYDQLGLGIIKITDYANGNLYRGGDFKTPQVQRLGPNPDPLGRHFDPGKWEHEGGIFSAWVVPNGTSSSNVGFRCTYIPEN